MAFKKFEKKDILNNVLKTHPDVKFDIYDTEIYYNSQTPPTGTAATGEHANATGVPSGYLSLYEMNVNNPATSLIYPFTYKDGSRTKLDQVSSTVFNDANFGDQLTGSYPMSASVTRSFLTTSANLQYNSLKNVLDNYSILSRQFQYRSDSFQTSSLISIPSIFFGSHIEKGTVDLKFYVSGTLIGHLQDERQNGELIQVGPVGSPGSSSCQGLVLYNEGFLMLTGSTDLSNGSFTADYEPAAIGAEAPCWKYFGAGANDGISVGTLPSSSFSIQLKGTTFTPTLTMFAHAERGEFNHSNNGTYIEFGQTKTYLSGANVFEEPSSLSIANIASSSFSAPTASFEKTTYISKIGVYDDNKNLIGIATLASPIKKTQTRNLTFKLKLDL